MKKIITMFLAAVLSIAAMVNVMAQDAGPFATENFSGTLTFTTDYTFRGTTFSSGEPTLQGSFDWGNGPWFAGIWGTSYSGRIAGDELEIDYYFGWSDSVGGVDLTIFPLLYTFPGQNSSLGKDDTTFELWTSIGRGIEGLPGSPYFNLDFNWAPNQYFDGGEEAYYFKPSITFTAPAGISFDIAYGYQDVAGGENSGNSEFFADDYSHIEVGISGSLAGFGLDLRYHDNQDGNTLNAFIPGFALENEVVFSIARSF